MWSEEKLKIAHRCGEKHILKWKCTKQVSFTALFKVLMSKNCTPLWREAYHEVKMLKEKLRVREHFLKFWCRKIARSCGEKHIIKSKCTKHLMVGALFEVLMSKKHAAVTKSTLSSQNVQNTSWLEHFLKFWCRKIARSCGEKHIIKSKCTKHVSSGQFFEVLMSKNCMNLWREAHLSVKMYKIPVFWRTLSSADAQQVVR